MKMQEQMQEMEQSVLHTYNRFPIVLDHGEGVYLYDTEGKKYLDFCAGIAVFALGYNQPKFNAAVKAQIDIRTDGKAGMGSEPAAHIDIDLCHLGSGILRTCCFITVCCVGICLGFFFLFFVGCVHCRNGDSHHRSQYQNQRQ